MFKNYEVREILYVVVKLQLLLLFEIEEGILKQQIATENL